MKVVEALPDDYILCANCQEINHIDEFVNTICPSCGQDAD